jgi:hypothetical protein
MSTTYYIGKDDLDVTYNYAWIFYRLHNKGLQSISGLTGKKALILLMEFEAKLTDSGFGSASKYNIQEQSYWICSPNNAYHNAVKPLIELAKKYPRHKFLCH